MCVLPEVASPNRKVRHNKLKQNTLLFFGGGGAGGEGAAVTERHRLPGPRAKLRTEQARGMGEVLMAWHSMARCGRYFTFCFYST